MTTRKILFSLLFALLVGLFVVSVVSAQDPTPSDDQVNAIAKQLYCPVCENIPLDVCPTTACARWRELIREKLAAGWSEQKIKDYFVQQYGARVLGTPPARGFTWLVYIIPPVAILAGAFVLYRAFRTWKRPTTPTESPANSPGGPPAGEGTAQDEYLKRMEEELRKD